MTEATSTSPAAPPTSPGTMGVTRPTNVLAVTSLILGLIGFVVPLVNLVAIVLGSIALVKLNRSGGREQGYGYAIVGVSLGVLGFLIMLMLVFMSIGMVFAIRSTASFMQGPRLQEIYSLYADFADDKGRYPVHVAELVTHDATIPLHNWVVDGWAVQNVNQVTVGNYDFINYDFSPAAIDAVRQAVETVETETPFYRFGDCWFARLAAPTEDGRIVLGWTVPNDDGDRMVLFDDGDWRLAPADGWEKAWEDDAAGRKALGLPPVEPPRE